MVRKEFIRTISDTTTVWDMVVAGGGATGLGVALDAASRGYKVALFEQADFTQSTSSRSTKLVHGGVRYLAQGDVGLVVEALHERGVMIRIAPHLVKDQRFIIGNYKWWEKPFYTVGLMLYDLLAGKLGLGRSLPVSKKRVIEEIPRIKVEGLKGGVVYHDGQFDDARMAINLMQTAIEQQAVVLNYMKVISLEKNKEAKIEAVVVRDEMDNRTYRIQTKTVINATGIFVDELMQMDAPELTKMVRPSQGVHLVVDRSFLGGETAIMIPKTSDGRVMFGVPWRGKVVLGTTDTPVDDFLLEPKALEEEISFILETAGQYLAKQPKREDVLSVFAGLRPLAAPRNNDRSKTKEISRRHKIVVSESGLVTVTGGKWTTYRAMAEETVDRAAITGCLAKQKCQTKDILIHGYKKNVDRSRQGYVYGTDYEKITVLAKERAEWAELLHPAYEFIGAEVIWAVRNEMALTVEDVLARRLRILFLDARAARQMAPKVASLMAGEMNKSVDWINDQVNDFDKLAKNYLLVPSK